MYVLKYIYNIEVLLLHFSKIVNDNLHEARVFLMPFYKV